MSVTSICNPIEYIVANIAPRLSGKALLCIPVNPVGEPRRCHENVQEYIKVHYGQVVSGWIFQVSKDGRIIRAIWHSVWKDTKGNLVDLTPDPTDAKECKIFNGFAAGEDNMRHFLPADNLHKEGDFDFPTTKNKAVKRFIRKIARYDFHYRRLEKRTGIPYDVLLDIDIKNHRSRKL